MDTPLEVMAKLHAAIQEQYQQHDRVSQHCYFSALSIAEALILGEGKSPEIREYRVVGGKPKDGRKFKVRGYERMEGFAHHMACVCEGMVYEPLYNRVIAEADYPHELAGIDLDCKSEDSPQDLKRILNQ